jgi:hypothetical protein
MWGTRRNLVTPLLVFPLAQTFHHWPKLWIFSEKEKSWPLSSMCLWTMFRITFSNSLPVVDKRQIGRKFWENLGSLPRLSNVITFVSFQGFEKWDSKRQWLNKCVRCISGLFGRCLRHSFGIPSSQQAFLDFNEFANLRMLQGLIFPKEVSSTDARALTLVSTCRSWFSSHRSWDVNWFSKQSAIMLAWTA